MTSRLKHKLELENVNLKSAYLNESFVQIGTPLPALADHRKDKLEYLPEWQQEVRDEKGRRRFHGAFTGGFSAGYYNSVGSQEGWAPSSFKSSKNNRATKVQRAEDFMDEEDLEALKDDRKLENTDTFKDGGFAGMRESTGDRQPDVLESLIAPARTSIGQTLLQKQGWRPGQGIGPRVTARKLKWQEAKMGLAGPSRGQRDEDEDMEGGEAGKHTFAPRDTKLVVYQSKDDREGLGFQKGMGMGKLPQSRKAGPSFGVGYVNDDDDDDDPYGTTGASSSSLAFAFDNATEQNDDMIVMGEMSKPPGRSQNSTPRQPGSTDTWHDGRPVLPGFVLDPLGVPTDRWFEMPEIPDDWRPRPARVWGTTRQWDELPGTVAPEKEVIRGAPGRPLTFEQRGDALGEVSRVPKAGPSVSAAEPHVSKAKSVFEYMSEKEKERLASILATSKEGPPPALLTAAEAAKEEEGPGAPAEGVEIPPLSPRTASSALRGYMPYNDDVEKQERYRTYLVSQTYNTKEPNPSLKPGASFDAINKELEDFASSARIFKPMAFAMSSRFTSGSASLATSDLKQAKPGLHVYDATKAKAEAELKKEPVPEAKKAMTPREQAADMGQYGRLTREVAEFYPVKLLCKRFGVADPHPEGKPEAANTGAGSSTPGNGLESAPLPKNDASWASAFVHQSADDEAAPPTQDDNAGERVPRSLGEVGMADDVNQGRDTLIYTKPSIDIFKAIFASDDEDSDDEDDAVDVKPIIPAPRVTADPFPPKRDEKPLAVDDLSAFKPVYRKAADPPAADSGGKRKKDKKKRKGVLSFEVGDEGEDGDVDRSKEDRRKKRKEIGTPLAISNGAEVNEAPLEEEWVEKTGIPVARAAHRKGAADFM